MTREALAVMAHGFLRELDVEVAGDAVLRACEYLLEFLETNRRLNLTAIRDPEQAVRLHVVDSLAVLPFLAGAVDGPLCDLGTGGGFPGVPLSIASGRTTVLLDSVSRKVEAVRDLLARTHLPAITAVNDRAEHYAIAHPSEYAVVACRAVAELPVVVEYAAPLLAENGLLVAMKGRPSREEIERGMIAARLCGLAAEGRHAYSLPGGGEAREVLVYRRTGNAHVALPRGTGRAAKHPLA